MIEQIARYPRGYADTTGVWRFDSLIKALRTAGAGKPIFGSTPSRIELETIRLMKLAPDGSVV